MVVVQLLAFGRIQDNRVQIKAKRAAKLDKEKKFKEKVAKLEEERRGQMKIAQVDGGCELFEDVERCVSPCTHGRAANGSAKSMNGKLSENGDVNGEIESETSEELMETSEEELFI